MNVSNYLDVFINKLPLLNSLILLCFIYYIKAYNLITFKVNIIKLEFQAKTYQLVAILTFLLLASIIIFVTLATYKLLFTYDKQTISDMSAAMMQVFVAILGIILAIIGFWSYSSIKEHAVKKSMELTNKKLREYEKEFHELFKNTAKARNSYEEIIRNVSNFTTVSNNIPKVEQTTTKLITEEEMRNE